MTPLAVYLGCSSEEEGAVVLNDPFILHTPLARKALAQQIGSSAPLATLAIYAAPGWEEMEQEIRNAHLTSGLLLSDVADFGIRAYRNARQNWESAGPFADWRSLRQCCRGVPAIVCGAGASLAQAAGRCFSALVIGAGNAISRLQGMGILPHLACVLDPESPAAYLNALPPRIPVCFQSRVAPEAFQAARGLKILIPEQGVLPWERHWIEEEPPFAAGWTVGTFAASLAVLMGCNPIVLAGMDCSAEGRTQNDWLMARQFLEELADAHPERRFIAAGTGGLSFRAPIETLVWEEISLKNVPFSLPPLPLRDPIPAAKSRLWDESVERCCAFGESFEEEPVYRLYLSPLWDVWKNAFALAAPGQSLALHRRLFFERVLQEMVFVNLDKI